MVLDCGRAVFFLESAGNAGEGSLVLELILGLSGPIITYDCLDFVPVAPVLADPKEAGSEITEATRV